MELKITLPVADDNFGQWMEDNGTNISIDCMFGDYGVTISWCRVHRYSDDRGEHRESWRVSRRDRNLAKAFALAIEAAKSEQARK